MNARLLSTLISFPMMTSMYSLAGVPIEATVYGRLNLTGVYAEESTANSNKLNSYFSHFGVDFDYQLSETLSLFTKIEHELIVDNEAEDLRYRSIEPALVYVGISGNGGTLLVGNNNSPLRKSQRKVDLFNELEGDIGHILPGETLARNMVSYTSPKIADRVDFTIGSRMSKNGGKDSPKNFSSSVHLDYDNLYFALAVDRNMLSSSFEKEQLDIVRLVGSYAFKGLQVGALLQDAKNGSGYATDYRAQSWLISAKYEAGRHHFKAQFGKTDTDKLNQLTDVKQWSVGLDISVTNRFKLLTYYTELFKSEVAVVDTNQKYFGFGAQYDF